MFKTFLTESLIILGLFRSSCSSSTSSSSQIIPPQTFQTWSDNSTTISDTERSLSSCVNNESDNCGNTDSHDIITSHQTIVRNDAEDSGATFKCINKPNWLSTANDSTIKDENVNERNTNTDTKKEIIETKGKESLRERKETSFESASHEGCSVQPDPITQTGGWYAHRAALLKEKQKCWIRDEVAPKLTRFRYESMPIGRPPRVLVLYGSLRRNSFSRKLAYEFARLLECLGCEVRTYNPQNLPVRNDEENPDRGALHPKVLELRALTEWSDGHMWVSPEMHGQITGTFKNQIDWIPLNTGSVRPTQGKVCCVAQVNGGSQSFNAVNTLRLLARWMRMPCVTNQSSVPKAWQEFDDEESGGRMKDSSYRDRVVDVAEEFAKFVAILTPMKDELTDRYSERKERENEGRLLTQAEKETKKTVEESRKA